MSDELSNATRIAALEEQVRQLQRAHAEVACENARLTNDMGIISNRASMDREEIDSMAKQNDELRADIQDMRSMYEERSEYAERLLAENVRLTNEAAFMRSFINNEDVRSDFQTVTQMRQALDRERERCGVLEREVKAWHAAEHLRKDEWHAEFGELVEARWNTARTHALDAAKFVGGG